MPRASRTHEEFVIDMKHINPNVVVLGKYIKSNMKVKCQCKICGNIWTPIPNNLYRGSKCPKCSRISRRNDPENFLLKLSKINPDIEVLSTYKTATEYVKAICKNVGVYGVLGLEIFCLGKDALNVL